MATNEDILRAVKELGAHTATREELAALRRVFLALHLEIGQLKTELARLRVAQESQGEAVTELADAAYDAPYDPALDRMDGHTTRSRSD